MQFGGLNSQGFVRESKEKLEGLQWSEREGESCYLSTSEGEWSI
jgi:hypothetical protein